MPSLVSCLTRAEISSILWCHGTIELQMIALAGMAGLVLIRAWIAPGPWSRARAMALESEDFDLDQMKWVVMMVLFNQPGEEAAYTWMEDLVLDSMTGSLH